MNNWRIFIRKGPSLLADLGEGPFRTKRDAMLFANAEVYGDWYVAEVKPAPIMVHIDGKMWGRMCRDGRRAQAQHSRKVMDAMSHAFRAAKRNARK